ncbi:hypothetical protein DV704_04995 [Meiothermus sp. QL-1]|uniref:hypothetical protein n=1 Tax=Meiothermus sp. QL-1 TaxID=2058095 RepID=UPI000E0C0A4F|nr:hypothetical protein [Meiothermus sp. QL-1]RDI95640.1 hypothetical protein DV704_04995 [Meiothermus sp. QL-1]
MKKLVWMGFLLALSALAQGRPFVEAVTSNLGLVFTTPTQFNMDLRVNGGVKRLAGPFGVQGGAGIEVQQGTASFNLEAGALFSFGTSGLIPEAGLGIEANFGGNQTNFRVGALVGIEYELGRDRDLSLLFSVRPAVGFGGNQTTFSMNLRAGLRIYP